MGRGLKAAFAAVGATVLASVVLAGVGVSPAAAAEAAPATAEAATAAAVAPTGAALAAAYCDVTVTVTAQWANGYVVLITVRNISTVSVRWRRVDVRLPAPIYSPQAWNTGHAHIGQPSAFAPWPHGDLLSPGQTVTVGAVYASGGGGLPKSLVTCSPA